MPLTQAKVSTGEDISEAHVQNCAAVTSRFVSARSWPSPSADTTMHRYQSLLNYTPTSRHEQHKWQYKTLPAVCEHR